MQSKKAFILPLISALLLHYSCQDKNNKQSDPLFELLSAENK